MRLPPRLFLVIAALIPALPLAAAETIVVGQQGVLSWQQARESSRFVSVLGDSIWRWDITAAGNLARGITVRGGGVYDVLTAGVADEGTAAVPGAPEPVLPFDGGEALVDGDGTTYYDPDRMPLHQRETPIVIDLGAAFRVNRLRLFPRLDSINRNRFLQEFDISGTTGDGPLHRLIRFEAPGENVEPVVDRTFSARDVRFLILTPLANRPWEVAEIEVYGDGTVPVGEYLSVPLPVAHSTPVWGQLLIDASPMAGAGAGASIVIQTRTGPDASPELYFMRKGDELIPVTKVIWEGALEGLKGPVKANPDWSPWETVSDGLIQSPSLNRYIQFRLFLPEPGSILRQLRLEYSFPPIVRDLAAEIAPVTAAPGIMTEFTLSLRVLMETRGADVRRDTGFRQVQIRTGAQIGEVRRVFVDDEEVFATTRYELGQGFTVNLWRRVLQNGTFLQVEFTAAVLLERTRFEVRAIDQRRAASPDPGNETPTTTAYQVAREADVDLSTPGGSLTVRLDGSGSLGLVANLQPERRAITPNGDGIGDELRLSFSLLKLILPARVTLDIFDLGGRHLRRAYDADHANANLVITWDGTDAGGGPVPTGLYLYRLEVEAESGSEAHHGVVGVTY